MKIKHSIQTIDSHTCGHPTRLVISGIPFLKGGTVKEKRDYFKKHFDCLCGTIIHEPRGHIAMLAAVLVEPSEPKADAGIFFISTYKYFDMCGHGTIGAVTALLELGLLPSISPRTSLLLEVPAGLIPVKANVQDGEVIEVSFYNVPAFVDKSNIEIDLTGIGKIKIDIAYGGMWYCLVKASEIKTDIQPDNITKLMKLGNLIKETVNSYYKRDQSFPNIDSTLIYEFIDKPNKIKNIVILGPKKYDRSPCGTGTSALTSLFHYRGYLKKGDILKSYNILGTYFKSKIHKIIRYNNSFAIIPEITGSAYITGFNQLLVTERDPFKNGFILN